MAVISASSYAIDLASRIHEGIRTLKLEVNFPGYQTWKNEVPLKSGQHLLVEAKLQVPPPPEPQKPPAPLPVLVEPPRPPEPPPAPDLVTWPAAKFSLDASRHRLDLSSSGAVQVALEPGKTYRVALLGKTLTPGWAVYVVSDGGAKARPLSVLIEGQKKAQLKSVAPKLNFPSSQRVTVTGLSATTAYELTPHQGTPPAIARERGEPLKLVVVGTPSGLVIAPLDQAVRLEGLSSFWVTFIDDLSDAESGRLEFELREVRPIKKKKR